MNNINYYIKGFILSLLTGRLTLGVATGYWLLATGYWLLATGYWLLDAGLTSRSY